MSGRSIGGAERVVLGLIDEFVARGYRTVLACRSGSWVERCAIDRGVPVETLPMKGLSSKLIGPRRIKSIIERHRVDLVHSHLKLDSVIALPVAKRLGVRSVCTVHGLLEPLYCMDADATITVSDDIRCDIESRGFRGRVDVIQNGIGLPEYPLPNAGFREDHGFAPGDVLVGAVSRLAAVKGFDMLVRAAALLPEAKIVLVGYGKPRYLKKLRRLAQELGVGDRLFIFERVDVPWGVFASLDVFAMSSLREGLPMVLLEAAASALPIVATAVGGVPEFIRDGETGLLVPSGDHHSLARAIERVISDRDLAKRLGSFAREVVCDRFTSRRMADEVEQVYRRILG